MTDDATAPVEKVSQEAMLAQFQERFNNTVKENEELAKKIKENEINIETIKNNSFLKPGSVLKKIDILFNKVIIND